MPSTTQPRPQVERLIRQVDERPSVLGDASAETVRADSSRSAVAVERGEVASNALASQLVRARVRSVILELRTERLEPLTECHVAECGSPAESPAVRVRSSLHVPIWPSQWTGLYDASGCALFVARSSAESETRIEDGIKSVYGEVADHDDCAYDEDERHDHRQVELR
jgi:hypothetical protein